MKRYPPYTSSRESRYHTQYGRPFSLPRMLNENENINWRPKTFLSLPFALTLYLPVSLSRTFLHFKGLHSHGRESNKPKHNIHMPAHTHRERVRRERAHSHQRGSGRGAGVREERERCVEGSLDLREGHGGGDDVTTGEEGDVGGWVRLQIRGDGLRVECEKRKWDQDWKEIEINLENSIQISFSRERPEQREGKQTRSLGFPRGFYGGRKGGFLGPHWPKSGAPTLHTYCPEQWRQREGERGREREGEGTSEDGTGSMTMSSTPPLQKRGRGRGKGRGREGEKISFSKKMKSLQKSPLRWRDGADLMSFDFFCYLK